MFLKNRYPLWLRLVLVLGAISLFILAYQWGNQYQRRAAGPPVIRGVLIQPPASLPEFELRDRLGRPVDRAVLSQGWTLLAFGELSRASGQLAVQRLMDVYHRISAEPGLQRELRLVLITTVGAPELARDFAALLPALDVVSGEPDQVAALRESLGLGEAVTAALLVIGPGGHLLAFLPEDQPPADMAEDLVAIHDHAFALLPEDAS
jgi:hypothetical protein